jgi:hypothetical protein
LRCIYVCPPVKLIYNCKLTYLIDCMALLNGRLASAPGATIVRWPNGHMNESSPGRMVKWLDGHMVKLSDSLKVTRSNNQIVRWPDGSTTSAPSLKGCAILNPNTCPKIPPGHEGRPRIKSHYAWGGGTDPRANTNLCTKLGTGYTLSQSMRCTRHAWR